MKKPSSRKKPPTDGERKRRPSKRSRDASDELLPEYDGALVRTGVRGKYANEYAAGTSLVLLDPDVAQHFSNDGAVNDALREYLRGRRPK